MRGKWDISGFFVFLQGLKVGFYLFGFAQNSILRYLMLLCFVTNLAREMRIFMVCL
ncbi:hypothetical protein HMPREF9370_2058 [Neisseria wadsworthii 9715]|uniref:Uncharacterized protein n=1 Tax=Neisseria wadsworthii 9715 TaxID=1030841 RepID=G4CSJ8_9NEIS|nr:hypothetical protein HMPREF9370_2058 [Neisseria wadsworthii 9715]